MKIKADYLGWNTRTLFARAPRWLPEGKDICDSLTDTRPLALSCREGSSFMLPLKSTALDNVSSEHWSAQALMSLEHEERSDGALGLLTGLVQKWRTVISPHQHQNCSSVTPPYPFLSRGLKKPHPSIPVAGMSTWAAFFHRVKSSFSPHNFSCFLQCYHYRKPGHSALV